MAKTRALDRPRFLCWADEWSMCYAIAAGQNTKLLARCNEGFVRKLNLRSVSLSPRPGAGDPEAFGTVETTGQARLQGRGPKSPRSISPVTIILRFARGRRPLGSRGVEADLGILSTSNPWQARGYVPLRRMKIEGGNRLMNKP